ncbi:hypothetical protein WN943_009969 [Citrus x changshan-huyou]
MSSYVFAYCLPLPLLFFSLCQSSSPVQWCFHHSKLPLLSKICLLGLVGNIQQSGLFSDTRLQGANMQLSISCYHFQLPLPSHLLSFSVLPQNQNEIVVVVHAWRDGQRAVKASLAPTILLGRHYTAHFQSAQLQPGPLGYRTKREKASFMFKDINLHL